MEMRWTILLVVSVTLAALLACVATLVSIDTSEVSAQTSQQKPNIVYILTDDLDTYTLEQMETTRSLLATKGVTFKNATFSDPLCCPSRATMQRGQYPHNTGVMANNPPNGGFEAFHRLERYRSTSATWLNSAGYATGYFGKYMNGYEKFPNFEPPGWDRWYAANAAPMKKQFNVDGKTVTRADQTFDATVAEAGLKFIENRAPQAAPFYAAFNFYAPHYPAEHPKSFDTLYTNAQLPPDLSFDEEDVSDKPGWVRRLDRVDSTEGQALTRFHRDRLRSVEYVDRAVSRIVNTLSSSGELGNTYIVFWGDNGYHLGQHRLLDQSNGGKLSPYTHDVQLPMYVRGPGIRAGSVSEKMVSNVDIARTFADMGKVPQASVPSFVDGRSLLPLAKGVPVEWRDFAYSAAWPRSEGTVVYMEDWRQIRTTGYAYHYYPRTGEEELYDLARDPYELTNLLYDEGALSDEERDILERYRDLSQSMNTCSGAGCRAIEEEL
jgi:N-acetylglucosamine-6-sulfatase